MPTPEFFRHLGLFVIDDFLDPSLCLELCEEMRRATSKQGKIVSSNGEELTDESVRRVQRAKVHGPNGGLLVERLNALRPRLEEHFDVSLGNSVTPEFLIYNERGFYAPHIDGNGDSHIPNYRRRVSLVIFLNGESEQVAEGCFGGGKLTFYGLFKEPQWSNCGFPIHPKPGLLVAFHSDVLHEVTPVTFGQRFTVVSWFLAASSTKRDHVLRLQ